MDKHLLVLPFGRNGKRATIDTRWIALHIGGIFLVWSGHHIRRIDFEGIAAAAVDGRTIAIHLPIARNVEGLPLRIVEIILPKAVGLFVGSLRPIELPISVKGDLTGMMEIGACRLAVYLEDTLVFPIMILGGG